MKWKTRLLASLITAILTFSAIGQVADASTPAALPDTGLSVSLGKVAQTLWDGGTAVGFYGQKMNDPKTHCYGGLYGYRAAGSTNSASGYIVMGVDHLWSSQAGAAPANFTLSGGVSIDSKDYYIADAFGVTNSWLNKVSVKTFGTLLVGSPTAGGASLMNVERVGGYISIHDWTIFNRYIIEPDLGLAYGNRNGVNSTYNGNWWNVFFAVSIHGNKP